jgi:hypothetical protein
VRKFNYNFWDQPYLKAAGEQFKAVFLAFHPFFRVEGLDADAAELDPEGPFYELLKGPNGWRAKSSVIKRSGEAITWAHVVQGAGLRDTRQLCQAYYSYFNRLVEPLNDRCASAQLDNFTRENGLFWPEEDLIPALCEISIGLLYRRTGIDTIFIGDDWLDEWKSIKIDKLLDPTTSIVEARDLPRAKCSFSCGHEIVTVSCVNDPYTIVCLSPKAADATDPSTLFEGFWADDTTDFDWWLSDR